MRVIVSLLNFRPGRIGGVETYLRALAVHLPNVASRDDVVFLLDRDVARELKLPGVQVAVVERSARQVQMERILEATTLYRARHVERALAALRPASAGDVPENDRMSLRVGRS